MANTNEVLNDISIMNGASLKEEVSFSDVDVERIRQYAAHVAKREVADEITAEDLKVIDELVVSTYKANSTAVKKEKTQNTLGGYTKLVLELEFRKVVERNRIKKDIETARGFGDLSENAEYDAARNEQGNNEARINELEKLVLNAEIVNEAQIDTTVISVGSLVKVENVDNGRVSEYRIVGTNEADPRSGKISDVCPIGLAIVGKKVGQEASVVLPKGAMTLKILSVTRVKG